MAVKAGIQLFIKNMPDYNIAIHVYKQIVMNKITEYVKANHWISDDNTQKCVFDLIANVTSAHIKDKQPQTLSETQAIISIYDNVWRTLAKMYFEEFNKMVLDFDYYKVEMNKIIIPYYKETENI